MPRALDTPKAQWSKKETLLLHRDAFNTPASGPVTLSTREAGQRCLAWHNGGGLQLPACGGEEELIRNLRGAWHKGARQGCVDPTKRHAKQAALFRSKMMMMMTFMNSKSQR